MQKHYHGITESAQREQARDNRRHTAKRRAYKTLDAYNKAKRRMEAK